MKKPYYLKKNITGFTYPLSYAIFFVEVPFLFIILYPFILQITKSVYLTDDTKAKIFF